MPETTAQHGSGNRPSDGGAKVLRHFSTFLFVPIARFGPMAVAAVLS